MKLKSLEVKGFKSFPDKINLDLDHRVTGVVGPNGCGKSNIIDAIRWVIGEQRIRNLRSDSLDDLIFNGSKSRKPSGMAEVAITFENTKNILPTEYTTVTITRRFFKTGESEYRLNGVVCRLRDIHSLLMDTGISSDSYAIIELGMVDDIIRDKEGSRRRMMEQASGITIYKARRREAQQKLAATDLDLDRIEDLLFEITNNLKSLEQQAKRAERYYQLRTEYKDLSVELAKVSLGDFNNSYQELQDKKNEYTDQKIALEASIAGEEASIQERKVTLVDKEKELHYLQKQFNDVIASIRVLESERKLASQHLQHLKDRDQSLQQIISQAKMQLVLIDEQEGDLKEKIEDQIDKVMYVEEEVEIAQEKYQDLQNELTAFRKEVDEVRNVVGELQQERFELEKEAAVQDQSTGALHQQRKRVAERLEQYKVQYQQHDESFKALNTQKEDLTKQVEKVLAEKAKMTTDLERQEQLYKQLEQEKSNALRGLDARMNERDLLKSLVANMEGYSDSIRFLEEQKSQGFKGDLLSELFSVNKEWSAIIEAYLKDWLSYYVVETHEEAQLAIQSLQNAGKGKVGFWILEEIEATFKSLNDAESEVLQELNFDAKYQLLFKYLFQKVLPVHTLNDLPAASERKNQIFLVLENQQIIINGRVYGGGIEEERTTIIGRSFRIDELDREIEELQELLEKTVAQLLEINSNSKVLKEAIQALPLQQLERSLSQSEVQIPLLVQRKKEINEQIIQLEKEHSDIELQLKALLENQPDRQGVLQSILDKLVEAQAELQNKTNVYQEKEARLNQEQQSLQLIQLSLQQEKNKASQWKQEIVYKQQQKQDVTLQIEQQSAQLKETQQKISETDGKLNFGTDELEELLVKKEEEEVKLNILDKDYYAFRNKITEDEQAISGIRRKKEQFETLIKGVEESISQMKLQVAGIKERLTLEFNLSLEEVLESPRETTHSLEELTALTEKNKRRLENIGAINPTAIEAYQEIKLRHDFIFTQKNDLLDARNSLFQTIEEVERTANEKFQATFDAVRENFVNVFKTLFTEDDHADLKLTVPDNIAESNIEIYAQPKGKRPSTLTQLSGGEKTLTSIAFLFAIYLIKPAPFCILDEVDAPLDDANVEKFTKMIRQFSDNSQFIMVTHNKQTMAAVDVIYGVTMQEPGVSKIVPVDFRSLVHQ